MCKLQDKRHVIARRYLWVLVGLIYFHLPPVKGSAWHSRARRALGTPPELPLVPTQELLMETPGAKPSRYVAAVTVVESSVVCWSTANMPVYFSKA